ncbi:hypothetical protein T35B1_18643 [Salinisphaera shabanensis T35B1]|uniref:hypothetical protein n=1 Tax=Salinisphaera shabanensis TaxID=180542 RepID=UPI00333EC955
MKAQQKMFGAELAEGHDSRSQPRASILQKRVNAVHWSAPFTLKERQCANVLLQNAMSEEAGHESVDSFKKRREHRIYLPDLVEALFGNRGNRDRTGHREIEIGLGTGVRKDAPVHPSPRID